MYLSESVQLMLHKQISSLARHLWDVNQQNVSVDVAFTVRLEVTEWAAELRGDATF